MLFNIDSIKDSDN